jgi:hypothetical protein
MVFCIKDTQYNKSAIMLSVVILSVVILSVIMLSVVMVSVVMLNVGMLNFVAPSTVHSVCLLVANVNLRL